MSKSSIVTGRETPLRDGATASAGGLTITSESFLIETDQRIELVDITDRISALVSRVGVREGMVSLWSMHTTCAVFMNESQRALHSDIKRFLEQMVSRDADWMHNDPDQSDCNRMNADAHLRAMLLGHNLTLQVSGREAVLGQWQRVLVAELDGPRARTIRAQVWGLA